MAVSGAPETSVSRKRMRFTVPPADTYSGSWGYGSDEEIQEHSESDGGNEERQDKEDEQDQEESQRDEEPSESDGDGESLDEEGEQVEQDRQSDQELSESGSDKEGGQDEEGEQERQMDQESSESGGEDEVQGELDELLEQARQMDQESSESGREDEDQDEVDEQEWQMDEESSESDGEDEEQDEEDDQESQMDEESSESDGEDEEPDEEDDQVEQERQMDQESSESDGEDAEQDEVDEQVEQERQIDQELSESDGEDEEQNIEEELAEGESQSIQAPVESAGSEEEGHEEEDEQVEQEMRIDQECSESDGEDEELYAEELGEEESQNNPESAGGDEERPEEEDEQVEDVSDGERVHKSSSEPVLVPPPSKRTAIANMTLDEDMLDCGVCCLPLKPPIFQCDVGHVVCSSCRNKLAVAGRCHVCRTFFTGGYRRCHALEQLVESIRGSCPNASYGCVARVPYYDLHAHLRACPHAPCHCPAEACGFVGSTAALLHHFVGTHKWPCITGVQNREKRATDLHDGFNVVAVAHNAREYLFLLTVARTPFGRAISSLCLHPQAAVDDSSPSPSNNVNCQLYLSYARDILKDFNLVYHRQVSSFRVACTDLSNGMPNPNDCFQFIVPNALQPETEATVSVRASFHIQ